MDSLTIIPVAVAAYIATNLDNFTLLVSMLARYRSRAVVVALAYISSMFLLLGAGFWIGTAGDGLPVQYLGFLGVIPLGIGLVGLWRLMRRPPASTTGPIDHADKAQTVFVSSFLSQVGNGADTIITFSILFADSAPAADAIIVVTLMAVVVLFLASAVYGIRHPSVSDLAERYAPKVTPFLLIFVGIYVILNTATDLMPGT